MRGTSLHAVVRCAGLIFAGLVLAGGPAGAEEGLGRFSWSPSLRLTTVADDNVFLEDGNEDGSVGFWIAPRLELEYAAPAVQVGADLGVDFRRYLDHSSALAAELYRAIGWAEVGLRPGLTLRVANAFVPQPVRLGQPADDASNLVQTNRLDGELRWSREVDGNREIEVGAVGTYFLTDAYSEAVPQPGGGLVVDHRFRASYAQGLVFAEFQSPVGERTRAFLRGQGSYRAFTDAAPTDHSNLSLMTGVRSNRWTNLELELAGGVGALGFDAFADSVRALGQLSLRYRVEGGWTLSFLAHHLLTPDLAEVNVMETTGEVGVEKRFGTATAASVRFFATRYDGDLPGDAVDLFGAAEAQLRRQLTRHLQVAASYRHWFNRGDFSVDDFSQNRISVELGFRL
jgi:hypothetical protein